MIIAITNAGSVAGAEIVQIYVRDEKSKLPRPEKELVAFEKVFLEADETKHITIPLDKYAVGYYDDSLHMWVAEAGAFKILVGASSIDIR
jgi:beta-glucosidase